jgi:hypothetical protein
MVMYFHHQFINHIVMDKKKRREPAEKIGTFNTFLCYNTRLMEQFIFFGSSFNIDHSRGKTSSN